MVDAWPFDPASFFVLLTMGCVSLVLSFYFYSKHRALKGISKNLAVTVWDKTFSVYPPSEKRSSMPAFVLLPLILVLMYVFIGFLILKILEMGLVVGISVFILSLGLLMIDEALETRDHANLFINALNNKAELAKGDVNTLFMVSRVMPRLSVYYVFTAIVFFASAYALPYMIPAMIIGLSVYFGTAAEVASPLGAWMPYVTLFAFTFLFVMVYFAGGKLKTKIFGFAPSVPFRAMEEQFERGVRTITRGDRPPFEMSHRPILEEPEVEERKRRGLSEEE